MTYQEYVARQRDRFLAELQEFCRFPSISTLPAHAPDVRRCAEWLAGHLQGIGLEHAAVLPTAGHPVVYADWLHAGPGAPTVLIYGHYDVQPVEPLHLWETPPFDPRERDGRLYARGASDNKGQIFTYLKSLEALLRTAGGLPVNVRLLIEGEEEQGSPHLEPFIAAHADLLQASVCLNSDSGFFAPGVPSIAVGLRGLAGLEITVRGAQGDLHSGMYGGTVANPIHALARIVAGLHTPDGRVAVAGFYDRVRELPAAERAEWAALPFSEEAYRAELGVPALYGEPGFNTLERAWARPTLEVNGLWGGHTGEGTKTVLPAEAHAKITCRLVPDQVPEEVLGLVRRHVQQHAPPGVTVTVHAERASARPVLLDRDHPALQAAREALAEAYGRPVPLVRLGWTVPVAEIMQRVLGLGSVLLGFALPGENFHAPNEHFHLENFDGGLRCLGRLWPRLAHWRP